MRQLLIAFLLIFGLSVNAFANDEAMAVTPPPSKPLIWYKHSLTKCCSWMYATPSKSCLSALPI
jgi:hypothetical protein